jgi:protease-4
MSEKKSFLRRAFGFLWGAVVTVYRLLFALSLLLTLFVVWTMLRGGPAPVVEDNVALVLWPTGTLVEQSEDDASTAFLQRVSQQTPASTLLRDLIESLEEAAEDPRISLAILQLDDLQAASLPQLDELAGAMKEFQDAGKKIYVHSASLTQAGYYAAAQADDVSLDPMGSVLIEGFSTYNNYFKDALDKLGVNVHVFRVGEYKSAVEPYLRNDMSEDAKRANREWLGDLWKGYDTTVSGARKLDGGSVDRYVAGFAEGLKSAEGSAAQYAKTSGLVDEVETLGDFRKRIGAVVGFDDKHGSFRQINYLDYLRAVDHEQTRLDPQAGDRSIGLVVVQGEIVDGQGERDQAGGDTISGLLDEALRDKDVAAVVLRVDSPGGSVWAAEQIRRGVQALRAAGKPVVASMSTLAASGGYWVSMDADQIWAHPNTITGSIGIFGLIPTLEKPLEKWGIHTDGVGTTPLAGALRIDRPLSPDVEAIIQAQIDRGYREFIGGVAKGRNLDVDAVDKIARGRVWSGEDAKEIGLVDAFGGLEDALDAAAALAKLPEDQWTLKEFMPDRGFPVQWLGQFFGSVGIEASVLPAPWRSWMEQADVRAQLQRLNDPRGMYAICPCEPENGSAPQRSVRAALPVF